MPFLRLGKWPQDERSLNFVTGEREMGVSAFPLRWDTRTEKWDIDFAAVDDPEVLAEQFVAMIGFGRRVRGDRPLPPLFLVDGTVIGFGNDGEPLLRNVSLMEELDPQDLQSLYLEQNWPDIAI